jgi:enterochelin esterase-like enzyme
MKCPHFVALWFLLCLQLPSIAQDKPPFSWVNPLTQQELEAAPGLNHHTFKSKIIGKEVGYCVFLPPDYHDPINSQRRYPVVYMLHGGRPGDESKFAGLLPYMLDEINDGGLIPAIMVLNNGGPVSHYNVPGRAEALGKDLFIQELIPLIDTQYRTIADRSGRALSGYSQGGRATARIGFGHPELFSQLVIGSPGATTEKLIQDTGGIESEHLVFAKGDDMWTLAEIYADQYQEKYPIEIFLHVGDALDSNHGGTAAYDAFLTQLGLPHDFVVLSNQKHGFSAIVRLNPAIAAFHNSVFVKHLKSQNPLTVYTNKVAH